jgi:hypothetical protein
MDRTRLNAEVRPPLTETPISTHGGVIAKVRAALA